MNAFPKKAGAVVVGALRAHKSFQKVCFGHR
jgi:hypothetical protein